MGFENSPLYIRKLDQINEIISYLYESTSDKYTKYTQYLRKLQKVIYFDFGNVVFYCKNNDSFDLDFFCQIGWPEEIEQLYTSQYYKEDDVFQIFAKKTQVIMKSSDMFDETRTVSSYYASFMAIAEFDLSLECNIVMPDELNLYGICSLFRKTPKNDFVFEEQRVLEIIQPHLSNSAMIGGSEKEIKEYSMQEPLSGDIIFDRNKKIVKITEEFKKIIHRYHCNHQEMIKQLLEASDFGTMYKFSDIPVFAEMQEMTSESQGKYIYCRIYDVKRMSLHCLSCVKSSFGLSQKEFEILERMLSGSSREEIAKSLHYSLPTVKKHISAVYNKMSVKNFGQLLNKIGFL